MRGRPLVPWLVIAAGLVAFTRADCATTRRPAAKPTASPQPGRFASVAYTPPKITAKVKPYQVAADLSNIANRKQLPKLAPEQKAALVKNASVGWPTPEQQLFFIYENNAYREIPSFITTDSVLQAYHIFYDFSLRQVETGHLDKELRRMTSDLLGASKQMLKRFPAPSLLHTAALNNVAYFGVASTLLGTKPSLPKEASGMVKEEVAKIRAHRERQRSSIFPYMIEFTQFVPRGHYTRSETFKRYFLAMMWYGLAPLALEWPESNPPGAGAPDYEQTLQALLICRMLGQTGTMKSWDAIYSPTSFYVGASDDLTPTEYGRLGEEIFGKGAAPERLANRELLGAFIQRAAKLRPPKIETYMLGAPNGPQFRLMGQRFIPDSRVLQEMTYPKVEQFGKEYRVFPRGLDLMAALGGARAAEHLDKLYNEPRFPRYVEQRQKMQAELGALSSETWQSNLYWGWLFTLRPFLQAKGEGYPSFMLTPAWSDKQLVASLASWTELRHDTILYGKQSASECGDGEEPPPPPKGYVEPEPEVYARLGWLTRLTAHGLKSRGLLDGALSSQFGDLEDLLEFLLNCSLKELRNEDLTKSEYEQIKGFGAHLEWLTLEMVKTPGQSGATDWSEITSTADKDMALIADVHTSAIPPEVLEEGVGHATELWVVIPAKGKLWAARGASFSYYEFRHPSSDRLTDEKWQQMLRSGKAPAVPSWIGSYVVGKGKQKRISPQEMQLSRSGC